MNIETICPASATYVNFVLRRDGRDINGCSFHAYPVSTPSVMRTP